MTKPLSLALMRSRLYPTVTSLGRSPGIIFLNINWVLVEPLSWLTDQKISRTAPVLQELPLWLNVIDPFPLPVRFQVLPIKQSIAASSNIDLTVAPDGKLCFSTEFRVHCPLTPLRHEAADGVEAPC